MASVRFAPMFRGASVFLCASVAAHACPVCHTATGFAVRAALFNGHFWQTLATVALPCPLLLLAVVLVHFGMPDLRDSAPHRAHTPVAETPGSAARAAA